MSLTGQFYGTLETTSSICVFYMDVIKQKTNLLLGPYIDNKNETGEWCYNSTMMTVVFCFQAEDEETICSCITTGLEQSTELHIYY